MNEEIDISVVIPAFNEEKRLPPFLKKLICYCTTSKKKYEIIVVDDGSTDDTYKQAMFFRAEFPGLYVLRINKNMGVGYVTRHGFLTAKGKILISMDADGSVSPEEIEKNLLFIGNGFDIVVGSRAIRGRSKVFRASFNRKIMSIVFNFLLRIILGMDIKDTQCGFMMFRRNIIKPLFSRMHLRRFGFYIELLYLAHKMGYSVKEAAVYWEDKAGTKVKIIRDSVTMFFNIFQVKYWHSSVARSTQ